MESIFTENSTCIIIFVPVSICTTSESLATLSLGLVSSCLSHKTPCTLASRWCLVLRGNYPKANTGICLYSVPLWKQDAEWLTTLSKLCELWRRPVVQCIRIFLSSYLLIMGIYGDRMDKQQQQIWFKKWQFHKHPQWFVLSNLLCLIKLDSKTSMAVSEIWIISSAKEREAKSDTALA